MVTNSRHSPILMPAPSHLLPLLEAHPTLADCVYCGLHRPLLGKDTSSEVPQFFYLRAFLAEGKSVLRMLPCFVYPILSLPCALLPL